MNVPLWAWALTIVGLIAIIVIDLIIVDHPGSKKTDGPKEFTLKQATRWVLIYVALAVLFGLGLLLFAGPRTGGEFFAGYLTEYSLSVDNLFIFYLIMARFAVPKRYQHEVLLVGIVIALIMRGMFIAVGATALNRFSWLFYIFGVFLLYTAWNTYRDARKKAAGEEEEYEENLMLRMMRRVLPSTDEYHGAKLTIKNDGRRLVTPMLIVMIAIGTTDLMFALDSIPAIFGLTQDAYIVFTANAFALMGLRQLYFLLGGLMERLVYISYGLTVILAFIGVKLILHAMHEGGIHVPDVNIWVSLGVIIGTMVVTTVASLMRSRKDRRNGADEEPAGVGGGTASTED
ncbi:MAG: TerC/Alx family metal homeostasis membrane protein [Streptosporangiales bacterium]|nr:TerC/Alx family metal homeostasis membrane protein [Streptosporangiales bacterium]